MKSFVNNIVDPIFATNKEKENEFWDVEGRLKGGNRPFKFDIRPLKAVDNNRSEKIVFEAIDHWVIFDTQELHEYIESKEKRDFNIEELLNNLSWNLILHK